MFSTLIALSLLIMLGLGVAALFLAGSSTKSSSMEDPARPEEGEE
ncbi:hypothetical protein Ga0074115_11930 [endosymbiont of Ridgeia piscesae]|jgi:hypothetical protein|uniref:Uncharacterized protein n=1 Tax=endosymbiont of Ridgeia piscesae TaxID=54398 RepID=A0A0T5YZA2_9GAMM|nr:hypothetical protein [endosymbiont of Ridgeia piscesae]KRT55493.1 hypothetical protein Ga0074115_11930 [endosymbiont of Ridgeia piscesae]